MTKIVKEFDVRAPPERVFETISRPEKYPQWADFVKAASSRGPKVHWVYEVGGMKVESDTETTDVRENELFGFRQTSGFLKSGENRFEIEPDDKGSSVRWTLEYELPYSYLGKLMDKLKAKHQFEAAMDQSIRNLSRVLER
jgi:uncharacterized membrane protein